MTRPIIPEEIFFLAASSADLSPPEVMILTAPAMTKKINQIMAIIVIRPIAEDINMEKMFIDSVASLPSKPRGPNPLNPSSGNNSIANDFIFIKSE